MRDNLSKEKGGPCDKGNSTKLYEHTGDGENNPSAGGIMPGYNEPEERSGNVRKGAGFIN